MHMYEYGVKFGKSRYKSVAVYLPTKRREDTAATTGVRGMKWNIPDPYHGNLLGSIVNSKQEP